VIGLGGSCISVHGQPRTIEAKTLKSTSWSVAAVTALAGSWLVLSAGACSASESRDPRGGGNGGSAGGSGATGGSGGFGAGGSGTMLDASGGTSGGDADPDAGCGTARADAVLETEPVDIILVVDNSGSMREELLSVEANINDNFAAVLQNSGVDYRLIAISRHRTDTNTSLCVRAPLSTLTSCPAPAPGLSDRFFHFNTKIESDDSLDRILDTYVQPFGGTCPSLCDNGQTSEDDGDDNSGNTQVGWHEWLRPGAKKVFLEITDDNDDMPAATFVRELTALSEEFGSVDEPKFTFHSIVGVVGKNPPTDAYLPDEPIQTDRCASVTTAGETYQELSILTGGLRFPICQFSAYDVVFNRIAQDVIVTTQLACDFAIPDPPPGRQLELDKIAVSYSSAGNLVADFGQVVNASECRPDAFYIENDRVVLCPEVCETISQDRQGSVNVLFTCESTFLPPT
jgi:hypothetical protein